jgi:hypothetical protein
MSTETPGEHVLELDEKPRDALRLLAEAAEDWGGAWQPRLGGGRLRLPVMAGLRRGWVAGEVTVEEGGDGSGSRLRLRVEESAYRVDRASVAVLVLAAGGALVMVLLPLFPQLIRLVPVGIVLAVGAWLFIVARLRNSGPEEFFQDLAERSAAERQG